MSLFNKKSKKGFLLTLLTLVIFILMLGELVTYVLVSSNYYSLAGDTSVALNSGSATLNLNTSMGQFLSESLSHAIIAINNYEVNSSLYNGTFINNTPLTIKILMENGTFEGNVIGYMSSYTINSYINSVKKSSSSEQIFINITNASLSIYQTNPFYVNAAYTAFANITSASGSTTYPIHVLAQAPLSYANDLFASEHGKHIDIIPTNITRAVPITESNVINNGSTSPFMFEYGKIYYYPGKLAPTNGCSAFSRSFENNNYILVVYNAISINSTACGFGGLVTNMLNNTPPYKPYLQLNVSVNNLTIIPIRNGTYALLDGPATSLLDISPILSALNTSYLYPSIYRPSYINRADGSQINSPGGSFYFYTPNIKVATITAPSTLPSNIINQNGTYNMNTTLSRLGFNYTISMWFDLKSISSKASSGAVYGDNFRSPIFDIYNKTGFDFGSAWAGGNLTSIGGGKNFMWSENYSANATYQQQNCVTENGTIQSNTWYNAVVKVFDYSKINIYLNGRLMNTCNIVTNTIFVALNSTNLAFAYGMNPGSTNAIANSSISNIQVYNTTLNNTLINEIYQNGIAGLPVSQNSLIYWAQLNGNINYYNGTRATRTLQPKSISNNVRFNNITNYSVDSTEFGINNMMNASSAYGFGCNNASNCTYSSLYLNNGKLSSGKIAYLNASANDYMTAYIGNWIDSNTNLTITAWFDGTSLGGPIFGLYSPSSGVNEALLSMDSNSAISAYLPGSGTTTLYAKFNTLYFAALTYNSISGFNTFYLNGKLIESGTITYTPIGMNEYFTNKITGTKPAFTPDYFNGYIYSLSVYSKNLTGTQLSNLYNEGPYGNPLYGVQDWWKTNGNLYDYGPQNNNGFYNGNFINSTRAFSTETDAFGIYKGIMPTYFSFTPDVNNGNIAYVNIPTLMPKSYSSFSYFGWVYATANEIDGRVFTTSAGDSGTIELAISNYTHPRLMVNGYGFSGWTGVGAPFKMNTWNFIGVVYNTSGAHIFLNGIDDYNSNPSESGATLGNMQIGATSSLVSANNQFLGDVSDFQFYNTGLNKSEVKSLYLNNTVRYVLPYAYLPLGIPNNSTLNQTPDITGGNSIGYLVGNIKGRTCTAENVSVGLCFVVYK